MGRLIDEDELLEAMDTWDKFGYLANYGLIRLGKENKYYVQYVRYEDMVKAVNGMPTVEAIPKADYETRLKAEKVAMLTEIQLEIEEHKMTSGVTNQGTWNECIACCGEIIQEKINALKKLNTARCELCKYYRFDDWWAIGWCPKPSIYEVRKEPGDKCEYFELKENKDGKDR